MSSQDIAYPVLIDPAWGYSLDYSVGSTDAAAAWSKLQKCFNCYFPIQGAPKAFPAYRQHLPLVVAFGPISGNFNCYMDITWRIASNIGYQFITASGHVDGAGSNIAFEFYKNRGGQNRLSVAAHIVNDFGALNSAYVVGASNTWAQFAANIQLVKA